MDNDTAQSVAEALRTFYRMGILSEDQLDKLINKVQLLLWKYEALQAASNLANPTNTR